MAAGSWDLQCWVVPGSGPVAARLYPADCGTAVSELFALAWQAGEGTPRSDSEGCSLDVSFGDVRLRLYSASDTVTLFGAAGQGTAFHAPGAEDLCRALMDLLPGPEVRYFLAADETMPTYEEQAALFARNFEASYRRSGVISDFRLDRAEFVAEEGDGYVDRYLLFSYAVKPAAPAWQAWQSYSAGADGWVEFSHRISFYEDADGDTRVFFFEESAAEAYS